jgi:phosphoribosyl 1,2-cyclic phosphodiesterase
LAAFVLQGSLGILTDLGHVFSGLDDLIASLDAVLLESNYDPDMLATGSYPDWLKKRITGPHGHISNFEAAELLLASASKRMKWVCLGHLSHDGRNPCSGERQPARVMGS